MAFGAPFPGVGAVKRVFLGSGPALANVTSPASVSLPFGVEAPNRYLAAAVSAGHTGGAVTGITIGGVAAAEVAVFDSGFNHASIWVALVPTGTSGNVVVSYAGGSIGGFDVGVGLYALTGNASPTPTVIGQAASSVTIAAPGSSAVIAAAFVSSGAITWSGLTDDADFSFITPHGSVASAQIGSSESLAIVTNASALAVAAWGP